MTRQNDTQRTQDDRTDNRQTGDTVRTDQRPRLNPRLVFTDPDSFFTDLLMEQEEQS